MDNKIPVVDFLPRQQSQPATPTAFTVDRSQPQSQAPGADLERSQATSSRKRLIQRQRQRHQRKERKALASMAKKTPPSDESIDFTDIKAWIAEQEASPAPAPLTKLQRRAITELQNSIKAAAEPKVEDSIGETDWVSLLLRYQDAHPEHGVSVDFVNSNYGPPWVIHCTIQSSRRDTDGQPMDRRFPDKDFGFLPMPHPNGVLCEPPFARKKDAKQYAAKCCVDFLMQEGHIPTDGVNVSFPRPNLRVPAPPTKRRRAVSAGVGTSSVDRPTTKAAEAVDGGAPVDVRDDYVSAAIHVEEMCKRLGIQTPKYKIEPAGTPTNYNGSAEFGVDMQIPDTVGRVSDCCGKGFTREKVAEEVIKYLLQVEAKRNSDADELLQAMASREVEDEL